MNSTKRLTALLLFAGLVPWIQCSIQLKQHSDDNYAMSNEFIAKINSMQSSWKAGRNFDPNVTKMNDIRSWCGAIENPKLEKSFKARSRAMYPDEPLPSDVTIPTEFDARKTWPNCTSIGLIRDQGSCGSCWAVSTASAISDRICIASGGKLNVQISAEDVVSCCPNCGIGCKGGYHSRAWDYYSDTGLSSGGEYNSGNGCKPYSFPNCEHHGNNGSYPPCSNGYAPTPECKPECTNPYYSKPYQQDKFYGNGPARWLYNQELIQLDIMKHGSVSATFDVYEDFAHYKSGVYVQTVGEIVSGHVMRVIGWGEENGTPYWLITNSWNEHWGDQGIVKFRRGTNECRIEEDMLAGYPKTY